VVSLQALSFELSGQSAFFKKPDVNEYAYFSYNNIHKPALLGLFGAILGYQGRRHSLQSMVVEYYEKLKHLKVSIRPLSKAGYFRKKIQTFNNSVGYASQEDGGNLVIRQQWLENPQWQIAILDDNSPTFLEFKNRIETKQFEFLPYLGSNDHFANISNAQIFALTKDFNSERIDSLFYGLLSEKDLFDPDLTEVKINPFFYKEFLPKSLVEGHYIYDYEQFYFTNYDALSCIGSENIYAVNDLNLFFF